MQQTEQIFPNDPISDSIADSISDQTESSPAESSRRRGAGWWVGLLLSVLVLGLTLYGAVAWSGSTDGANNGANNAAIGSGVPEVGAMAPDFELPNLNGGSVRLSDLRGQPVVLNFWATWCPPCIREMPALEALWQETSGQVIVLGVDQGERAETVADFVQRSAPVTFPLLLDRSQEIGDQYFVRSLPTTFFIDADGIIQDIRIGGPMAEDFLLQMGQQLLDSTP